MDYTKINKYIAGCNRHKIVSTEIGFFIAVSDNYAMFLINESDYIFDKKKIGYRQFNTDSMIKAIDQAKNDKSYEYATKMKLEKRGNRKVRCLKSKSNHAYADNMYLSLFDYECTFQVKDNISPIKVIECGILVALIMPVKFTNFDKEESE